MTRLPDRGDLEARIAAWSKEHDFVRAAILTSTRAMPRAVLDNFSDIDVILAVTDIIPLFQDRGWLSDFGEVLVVYRDPIGVDLGLERFRDVAQYTDGSKIDFTIWPAELVRRVTQGPELLEERDIGYRVLVDKDHLTEGLQPPSYRAHIPTPPSRERFLELVEDFFLESTYVVKHLSRKDLLPLKFSLDHVMKQGNLRIMLEWRIEIDHHWEARPGVAGKGFKKYLPPERARAPGWGRPNWSSARCRSWFKNCIWVHVIRSTLGCNHELPSLAAGGGWCKH